MGRENKRSVQTSRRFPARRKRGSRQRDRIPKRAKAEEKEKASAQCPMAVGRRPPPREKATSITRETATARSCRGNRSERTVKPTGNKQATEAAWKNIMTGVSTGPRKAPNSNVKIPVLNRKKVMEFFGPNRLVIHPERKRTTVPKTLEKPIRELAHGRSIPISFTRKRGIMV
jgi:hypothetical protein